MNGNIETTIQDESVLNESVDVNLDNELISQINQNLIASNTISICIGVLLTALLGVELVKAFFKRL